MTGSHNVLDFLPQGFMEQGVGLKGCFSSTELATVGMGGTAKKSLRKVMWYVQQTGKQEYTAWRLNAQMVPMRDSRTVKPEEFLIKYEPELKSFNEQVRPAMRKLAKTIARGERYRAKNKSFSAEMEFVSALKIDEENVRATFGLGLTYLEREDAARAKSVFNHLVQMDDAFQPEHKHLFNDFGIKLRKNKMFDQAEAYYKRALELCKDDENLYFNIARACYENGDFKECVKYLNACLKLNKEVDSAKKLILHIVRLDRDEGLRLKYGKPRVKANIGPGAREMLFELEQMARDQEVDERFAGATPMPGAKKCRAKGGAKRFVYTPNGDIDVVEDVDQL